MKLDRRAIGVWLLACLALFFVGALLLEEDGSSVAHAPPLGDAVDGAREVEAGSSRDAGSREVGAPSEQARPQEAADEVQQTAAPVRVPLDAEGRVDFAALGLTGKESGAELLRTAERRPSVAVDPRWEVGEEWQVLTWYRQMQAGDGQIWSGPARWKFRVDREQLWEGRPAQAVVVSLVDEAGAPDPSFPATTYYVAQDRPVLLGADLYHVRGGKGKHVRVAYRADEGASVAEGSVVPFELPPVGTQGKLSHGRELPRLEPMTARTRGRLPQPADLLGHGADAVEITFTAPDGTTVRQRWSPEDPRWPVLSETETRRSYRLR